MGNEPVATRRRLLAMGVSVATLSIAGCLGDDTAGDGDDANETTGEDRADENETEDGEDDHDDLVADVALVDRDTDEEVAYAHDDHWDGDLPPIPLDGAVSLEGVFEDGDGKEITVGEDEEYQLGADLAEGAQEGIVEVESHGDHVDLSGGGVGRTDLLFSLLHGDHADWESPAITAEIVEESADHDENASEDDHDHDENDSEGDHDEAEGDD